MRSMRRVFEVARTEWTAAFQNGEQRCPNDVSTDLLAPHSAPPNLKHLITIRTSHHPRRSQCDHAADLARALAANDAKRRRFLWERRLSTSEAGRSRHSR